MEQWETEVYVALTREELHKDLNEIGKEGWEPIGIYREDIPGSRPVLYAWVKRKIPEREPTVVEAVAGMSSPRKPSNINDDDQG